MSDDWLPLAQHVRRHMAAQLDAAILHGDDAELRSVLAAHRPLILELMCAKAEVVVLRELTACRAEAEDRDKLADQAMRLNGHTTVQ
jgi:hypothetical protein